MPSHCKFALPPRYRNIIVPVTFCVEDNLKTLSMILDTGATYTMFPFETARALGLDPSVPRRKIEIVTASTIEYRPIIVVPSVRAFGFEVRNLEVACHDLPPRAPCDGLLGLNFLRQFNILLYFPQNNYEVGQD